MDIQKKIIRMLQSQGTDLPTLSVIVDNILSAASDDSTSTEELARIINYDQAISSKLLRLSNSVYYGQRTTVDSIKRAISVIGFDEIIGITLGMSVLSSFADKNNGLTLDMKALWIHAIGCATAAKEIAMQTDPSVARKIFIPGLLHDMGKVIFSIYFKSDYKEVRESAIDEKRPLYRSETDHFKLDHAMLSGLLMKRWKFPVPIIMPCRFHHNPNACPPDYRNQAHIINLANYITHKANIGHSGNSVPVAAKDSPKRTGTSLNALRLIVEKLVKQEDQIKDFFKITT